jgi:xanthine dehydrogenase YagS FAD-binding subunit
MNRFSYLRASSVEEAVRAAAADPAARFIAGGTNLVDLMKYNVERPDRLIDITHLPLRHIEDSDGGGLRLGALVTNDETAYDPRIRDRYPLLASAILAGASPQLRNAATTGGNLLQRTRCYYFYDTATPCNKREPGTGCPAIPGVNRIHAILGTSEHCIATHPSDVAVPLVAFDAVVHTVGPSGTRTIPIRDFYLQPGSTPQVEHPLEHGELIVAVDLPPLPLAARSLYVKYRDRQSYEFALVSVAAAVAVDAAGVVTGVRLALGGVGTVPWRARRAEERLVGAPATAESFADAAAAELAAATTTPYNAFKVALAQRAIVRGLTRAAEGGRS